MRQDVRRGRPMSGRDRPSRRCVSQCRLRGELPDAGQLAIRDCRPWQPPVGARRSVAIRQADRQERRKIREPSESRCLPEETTRDEGNRKRSRQDEQQEHVCRGHRHDVRGARGDATPAQRAVLTRAKVPRAPESLRSPCPDMPVAMGGILRGGRQRAPRR